MEPEAAGRRLDTTIGAELTTLKRTAEGFTILQYYTRSVGIMAFCHARKHVECRMDGTRKIGSKNNFAGPYVEALA
eukprot:10685494-Ditylum_brightwellii.AAC.1